MKSIIKLFPQGVVLTLALTSLLACGLDTTSNKTAVAVPSPEKIQLSQNGQNQLPKAISKAVLRDASKRSGVRINNLTITQVTSQTFSNPCIFKFGEICTKEYNPIEGWEVIVQVKGQSWTYHVDKTGSQIVLDPKVVVSSNDKLPSAIANAILSDASKRTGLAVTALKITEVTPRTFSNPCFFGFGEVCTQLFDPVEGWEVIVKVKQQSWTYHASKSGSIVLDPKVSATPSK
ncbi:hypothetical protein NIES4074_39650 [Cylindrospermum sp. NIES-4074]|nr:hypothetical protein NIES4074_39650 [Cylindrospermum sp. NIES-4074]